MPDGPISAPVISGDSVYARFVVGPGVRLPGDVRRQRMPAPMGRRRRERPRIRPGVNDDFVYVTSDRLYAFPAACGSADRTCLPAWTAPLPDAPTGDAPAVGGGVVVVASDSVEGGVSAFPAVCTERCEPLWTGDTGGPATGVTIEGDTAYVMAQDRCWRSRSRARAPVTPPGLGRSCRAVRSRKGRRPRRASVPVRWRSRATTARSGYSPPPVRTPRAAPAVVRPRSRRLGRPLIEEGFVFVASEDGRLFAIGTGCDPRT